MTDLLKDNEEYIDTVALKAMETLMLRKPPNNVADSVAIASIAYKQALAMLDMKENLQSIYDSTGVLIRHKRKDKVKEINSQAQKISKG